MKIKNICIGLSLLLATTALSACGTETQADVTTRTAVETPSQSVSAFVTETQPAASDVDTADASRTLAYYAGVYGVGRCTIRIEALDETNANISITWGSSAAEMSEWKMTATFDPDTYRLTYSDCVKADVVYDESGASTRTVIYENGVGRFLLHPDHSMQWQDEQENAGEGMEFFYSSVN